MLDNIKKQNQTLVDGLVFISFKFYCNMNKH